MIYMYYDEDNVSRGLNDHFDANWDTLAGQFEVSPKLPDQHPSSLIGKGKKS